MDFRCKAQNIHSNHRNANHHLGLSGKSRIEGMFEKMAANPENAVAIAKG